MSGHSKWAQIKRSKGAKDAKRGVLFSKLSKKITLAAKAGGSPDPSLNFQLRSEIENAKAQGMPNDNIERAAKKAFDKTAAEIKEAVYEGYGPFGVAFLVESATDNTNRAVQNIKTIFTKNNGSLGSMGSVAWQFKTIGQVFAELGTATSEKLQEVAIESGAEDIIESEDGLEVVTIPENLATTTEKLREAGAIIQSSDVVKISTQPQKLTEDEFEKINILIELFEDNEDVVSVYTSAI